MITARAANRSIGIPQRNTNGEMDHFIKNDLALRINSELQVIKLKRLSHVKWLSYYRFRTSRARPEFNPEAVRGYS